MRLGESCPRAELLWWFSFCWCWSSLQFGHEGLCSFQGGAGRLADCGEPANPAVMTGEVFGDQVQPLREAAALVQEHYHPPWLLLSSHRWGVGGLQLTPGDKR